MLRKIHYDLIGQVFGRLTVIEYVGADAGGNAMWRCRCECGKERPIRATSLKDKRHPTQSCGCIRILTHCPRGHEFTPENSYIGPDKNKRCRICKAEGAKQRYIDNRDNMRAYLREWNLKTKGWTQETFDNVFKEQEGKCYICSRVLVIGIMGANMACADHVHSDPPRSRALLCNNCNAGIGVMQDNPALLRMAAEYIEKFK